MWAEQPFRCSFTKNKRNETNKLSSKIFIWPMKEFLRTSKGNCRETNWSATATAGSKCQHMCSLAIVVARATWVKFNRAAKHKKTA